MTRQGWLRWAAILGLVMVSAFGTRVATAEDLAPACGAGGPCMLEQGRYLARLPTGWDGVTPLAIIIDIHGFGGDPGDLVADHDLQAIADQAGAIFVAPEGLIGPRGRRSWSVSGRSDPARDDIAFIRAIRADVAKRWPVDADRVLLTGFSLGASLVWSVACNAPDGFTAFAPVAGAFWKPEPTRCPGPPVSVRHVHGLADPVMPMTGRAVGGGHQGDIRLAIDVMRRHDGCPDIPVPARNADVMGCRTWSAKACQSGREVVFCLNAGEHVYEPAWLAEALDWMASLPRHPAGH